MSDFAFRKASEAKQVRIVEFEGDPRVRDIEVAERAGLAQPRNIRQVIAGNVEELRRYGSLHSRRAVVERQQRGNIEVQEYWLNEGQALLVANADELQRYGVLRSRTANTPDPIGRGRPGTEYWLNEGQALLVAMFSEGDRAAAVRKELIDVFMAYRRGTLKAAPGESLRDPKVLRELLSDYAERLEEGPSRATMAPQKF